MVARVEQNVSRFVTSATNWPRAFLSFYRFFQHTVNSKQMLNKRFYSKLGLLVADATAQRSWTFTTDKPIKAD